MSTFFPGFATISPAKRRARKRAIQECGSVGVVLEGTFENWDLSDRLSYARAGRKPPSSRQAMMRELQKRRAKPAEFSKACESKFRRIVDGITHQFKRQRDGKKIRFCRVWGKDEPDLLVKVRLHGSGIQGGPYKSRSGKTGAAMTGAVVSGTVSFLAGDHPAYTRRFSGTSAPPTTIPEYEAWADPPFEKAISAAGIERLLSKMFSRYFPAGD